MHSHDERRPNTNRRGLKIVLGLTLAYVGVEVAGALLTRSLALLAEAGHMLTDVAGLALAQHPRRARERRTA